VEQAPPERDRANCHTVTAQSPATPNNHVNTIKVDVLMKDLG
jgi:hypothetical protein